MNIPSHIAIIMDGNGRWAKERDMPRIEGHASGVNTVEEIIQGCIDLKIKFLTLYVFSSENWKRPKNEVNILMSFLIQYLENKINEYMKKSIKLGVIGNIEELPDVIKNRLEDACEKTSKNTSLTLTLAINYGSRNEILRCVKKISKKVKNQALKVNEIDENVFSSFLDTSGLPDPDLLIRTGGNFRLSNFLLWQVSYSEIYITDKFWPDFDSEDLKLAIEDYGKRERRFGNIKG